MDTALLAGVVSFISFYVIIVSTVKFVEWLNHNNPHKKTEAEVKKEAEVERVVKKPDAPRPVVVTTLPTKRRTPPHRPVSPRPTVYDETPAAAPIDMNRVMGLDFGDSAPVSHNHSSWDSGSSSDHSHSCDTSSSSFDSGSGSGDCGGSGSGSGD